MHKQASLSLNDFNLLVHLGVSDEERANPQTVLLNLNIVFSSPPKALKTDNLADAMCYQQLTIAIQEKLAGRAFALVEHLAHEIYVIIESHVPFGARIQVRITKFPKIPGLSGGICFNYGDSSSETIEREERIS